ncbi:MAG: class I SAM-dependent methyltransferase [Acidobacteria bacterium]|nr:MAG: class I SAM-dependent methyltransferase [Acidobacteriota bacterium]
MDRRLSTWLQLREPADAHARAERLTLVVAGTLPVDEIVHVLDLGTGTGSNVRYLAPHLPRRQHWLAIDRDPAVLSLLPGMMSSWGAARFDKVETTGIECAIRGDLLECRVETRCLNLAGLDGPDIFAGRHLVTASALLDLVSEKWLRTLAARCRHVGATALFTITYNGWSSCSPEEPEDEMIRHLLNRHQMSDKGLGGLAAGPDAARIAARCFEDAGYRVWTAPSDWRLGSDRPEMQRCLIDGWATAATELVPDEAAGIAGWRDRRIGHVDAGRSQIVVGHLDVAAHPPLD